MNPIQRLRFNFYLDKQRRVLQQAEGYMRAGDQDEALALYRQVMANLGVDWFRDLTNQEILDGMDRIAAVCAQVGTTALEAASALRALGKEGASWTTN